MKMDQPIKPPRADEMIRKGECPGFLSHRMVRYFNKNEVVS